MQTNKFADHKIKRRCCSFGLFYWWKFHRFIVLGKWVCGTACVLVSFNASLKHLVATCCNILFHRSTSMTRQNLHFYCWRSGGVGWRLFEQSGRCFHAPITHVIPCAFIKRPLLRCRSSFCVSVCLLLVNCEKWQRKNRLWKAMSVVAHCTEIGSNRCSYCSETVLDSVLRASVVQRSSLITMTFLLPVFFFHIASDGVVDAFKSFRNDLFTQMDGWRPAFIQIWHLMNCINENFQRERTTTEKEVKKKKWKI